MINLGLPMIHRAHLYHALMHVIHFLFFCLPYASSFILSLLVTVFAIGLKIFYISTQWSFFTSEDLSI